jgi:hypothetical protein
MYRVIATEERYQNKTDVRNSFSYPVLELGRPSNDRLFSCEMICVYVIKVVLSRSTKPNEMLFEKAVISDDVRARQHRAKHVSGACQVVQWAP